ncbi:MAG: energy-coupling factor transporter transmembrane component T family protein [Bacilli bacterium]|jgi:energy-coupling factor transport system permease protein
MFNNFKGRYYPVSSEIHQMNPLNKLFSILLFLITIFFVHDYFSVLILSFLLILIILLTNIPLRNYLKVISNIKILLIFIVIINLVVGVDFLNTLMIILKIIMGVLSSLVFILTTKFWEINYALEKFLYPLKFLGISVKKMVLTLSLALNFIPLVFQQIEKISKSQASRGIDFKHVNLYKRILALTSLISPMMFLSFRRADNIALAMEVRLYDYNKKRTSYRYYRWSFFDILMFFIHLLIFIMIIGRSSL